MKSILIISGSPRPKGNTRKILRRVEEALSRQGEVTFEYTSLAKLEIENCRGCLKCMRRHEEQCPCHDDLLALRDSMQAADGVIFASPVYVHTVTALMKNFYDRLAFQCHRPAYFSKAALFLTTTELSGAQKTLDYMQFVAFTWGFRIAGSLNVVYPSFVSNNQYHQDTEAKIKKISQQFWNALTTTRPAPSVKEIAFFHLMRAKVTLHKDVFPHDYEHWQERGWLESEYFTNVPVSKTKSLIARTLVRLQIQHITRDAGIVLTPSAAIDNA